MEKQTNKERARCKEDKNADRLREFNQGLGSEGH